jgi:rare lipoprotein A
VGRAVRLAIMAALLSLLALSAGAHPLTGWWRYDPSYFRHGPLEHRDLRRTHTKWHEEHPGEPGGQHRELHHSLEHQHRAMHYHRVIRTQQGDATWYSAPGEPGACGEGLHGLYAAHKRFPCGSLVSVRHGGQHVFVRILDRGPFGPGRKIDLSRKAFSRLADPDAGVISVRIYRLEP